MISVIIVWLVSFTVSAEVVRYLWGGEHRNMPKYQGYIGVSVATLIALYFYNNMM